MGILRKLFWPISIVLIYGCSAISDGNYLDKYFKDYEKVYSKIDLDNFTNSPIDSSMIYFDLYYSEYGDLIEKIIDSDDRATGYLKNLNLDQLGLPGNVYLMYEFHSRLNEKSYSILDYKNIWDRYKKNKNNEDEIFRKNNEKLLLTQIRTTNKKFQVGDSLTLEFPIVRNSTFLLIFPYSLDLSVFKDTLKVKAILSEKKFDSLDLTYRLRLTYLSDDKVRILGNHRSLGDEIDLVLSEYGRLID